MTVKTYPMIEFRGSPGPWEVIGKQGTAVWSKSIMIAQMNASRENHREARANGVLMAASLNLLEALQAIIECKGSLIAPALIYRACDAIAKATKD